MAHVSKIHLETPLLNLNDFLLALSCKICVYIHIYIPTYIHTHLNMDINLDDQTQVDSKPAGQPEHASLNQRQLIAP